MKTVSLVLLISLAACANDQYNAPFGQKQQSDDVYKCKMKIVHEYDDNRPGIDYVPVVGWFAEVVNDTPASTPDGDLSVHDLNKAVTNCMRKKGYRGESN